MKEASLVKFYFAKYFLLALGLLQWCICVTFLVNHSDSPKGQWSAFLFFTIGLVILSLQMIFAGQIKRVAVGKKKIAVFSRGSVHRYEHDEIKSLKFIPAFNFWKMKIRGRKGHVYFLPCEESEVIYGLFPSAVAIQRKGK